MNATNVTRNGTRHAELMAINALLAYAPDADIEEPGFEHAEETWGDVDPRGGHIYPYGQKLHPSPRVDKSVLEECILYVTVEPCVMCASLLRQYRIKKVYFGAVNDKFGGTGGVFRIHKNSDRIPPVSPPNTDASGQGALPQRYAPVPLRVRRAGILPPASHRTSRAGSGGDSDGEAGPPEPRGPITIAIAEGTVPDDTNGDGGNVEPGFPVEGGWGRDEAVSLLRQFYVQENGRGEHFCSRPSA
jgi:tRNA(Arg) A34 adenosine deaminase TadA